MSIRVVRAGGSPHEIGHEHGRLLAEGLRAFVGDSLCRLNKVLQRGVTMARLRPLVAAYDDVISSAVPALAEEITGLAHGAEIDREYAVLLQLRREIMGYRTVRANGDCTTYSSGGVLAQTVDLNGNLDDHIAVLDVTTASRRALVLSFGGLLGYLGLNSDGLAIGLNLVLGGEWRPGVPPYLAIRHLLDTAGSVDEAVALLSRLPLASSRSIMLRDKKKSACAEVLDGQLRVVEGDRLAHTNHFLHPDFAPHDELNIFARRSSVRRLEACVAGMAGLSGPEEHFALLSTPPICVTDNGDIRRERTVAAVVMVPARGELHVRPGNPALSHTEVFSLGPGC